MRLKIFAYTETYAFESITFIMNELNSILKDHDLLLCYSDRKNPEKFSLPNMIQIPFRFNRLYNKLRWWSEQWGIYWSLYNRTFSKKLNDEIQKFNPDVIHCHFGTDFLRVFANLNSENRQMPFLISFYGFDATERLTNKAVVRKYKNYLSLRNIYSVAVSGNLVQNVTKKIEPYHPVQLLHSGIDTDFYKRKSIQRNSDEFVFLQVSSFFERKGHNYTLLAFKKFISQNRDRTYKYIIAGFGPLKNDIQRQIVELDLSDHVVLRGAVTPAEMVELSSSSNCFVHMSITSSKGEQEGLPNVLLEAMSLELPIMSTWHAGIPEIVEDGVNGILCREKDINGYVEAFAKISKWNTMPVNRQKIVEHFSFKTHMAVLYDTYTKIIRECAA